MICRNPCFANKHSTSTNQPFVAVDPNIEILLRLIPRERNVHAFDNAAAFRCREKRGSQKDLG